MTPEEAAAAIARPVLSFGSRFMFDPSTYADAAQHGFNGLDFYFAGRCGVLGDVDASVVASALGFFEPAAVRAMWEQGCAAQPATEAARLFAESCAAWGRQHLGEGPDYAELVSLAQRVVDATPGAALPLFAGWRHVPVPTDGPGGAMHLLNVLRELRGGAHLVAVVAAGVDPFEAVLARGGEANADLFGYHGPYPDVTHVTERLDHVEEHTNRLSARGFEALDAAERARFVELVAATRSALV